MPDSSPHPSTPWTGLLGDIVDKKHRTTNARTLIVTLTVCAVALLAALVGVVALVYLVWGAVPAAVSASSGLLALLGLGRQAIRRRGRRTDPPDHDTTSPGPPP